MCFYKQSCLTSLWGGRLDAAVTVSIGSQVRTDLPGGQPLRGWLIILLESTAIDSRSSDNASPMNLVSQSRVSVTDSTFPRKSCLVRILRGTNRLYRSSENCLTFRSPITERPPCRLSTRLRRNVEFRGSERWKILRNISYTSKETWTN